MKNKTFQKVIATFVILYILIYMVVIVLYHIGSDKIKNDYEEKTAIQLENFASNINQEVERIWPRVYMFLQNANIHTLESYQGKLNSRIRIRALLEMYEELEDLCLSSQYLSNACFLLDRDGENRRFYTVYYDKTFELAAEKIADSNLQEKQSVLLGENDVFLVSGDLGKNGTRTCVVLQLSKFKFVSDSKLISGDGERVIFKSVDSSSPFVWDISFGRREADGQPSLVEMSVPVETVGCILTKYCDNRVFAEFIRTFRAIFILIGFIFIISIFIFYKTAYKLVRKPIAVLTEAIDKIRQEDYSFKIKADEKDEFKPIFDIFNKMTGKLSYMIREVYEKTILLQKAQLSQYQAQIDPHFLYNSFYTMRRMLYMGQEDIVNKFLCYLGDYFTFLHQGKDKEVIFLKEELRHAQTYANIQEIRFHNRVRIEWKADENLCGERLVPRLIIQPLLENSFKYVVENKLSGGIIRVALTRNDGRLECVIEDNGNISEEQLGLIRNNLSDMHMNERISAIYNINRRLFLYYKKQVFFADRSPLGGLKISIGFPDDRQEG